MIGTCILSAYLVPFCFKPTYPALQGPLCPTSLYLLKPTHYLCTPVSTWNGACDDILWTQVSSEEPLAEQGPAFLFANSAERVPNSHHILFPLRWNWFPFWIGGFPPFPCRCAFVWPSSWPQICPFYDLYFYEYELLVCLASFFFAFLGPCLLSSLSPMPPKSFVDTLFLLFPPPFCAVLSTHHMYTIQICPFSHPFCFHISHFTLHLSHNHTSTPSDLVSSFPNPPCSTHAIFFACCSSCHEKSTLLLYCIHRVFSPDLLIVHIPQSIFWSPPFFSKFLLCPPWLIVIFPVSRTVASVDIRMFSQPSFSSHPNTRGSFFFFSPPNSIRFF